MSRSKIVFYGTEESETSHHELIAHRNANDEIYIEVSDGDRMNFPIRFICLDVPTAISLVKNLKREIGLINNPKKINEKHI